MPPAILSVEQLRITYRTRRGLVQAVRNVSFELASGEVLALIGESGSGKTTLGLSLINLLPKAAAVEAGRVVYHAPAGEAVDVLALSGDALRRYRWQDVAMVFQGAQSAFNPVLRIEDQFVDTARAHRASSAATTRRRARELLDLVRLDPERTARAYPHELSGGMRQRVLIALSLILNPKVLVLDEPTTALDILTQRAVIDLLRDVKREFDLSLVVVSHDLALAAELADRVAAMYAGRIVEAAPVEAAFYTPRHPYTVGLIRGVPRIREAEMGFHSIPGSPPDLIQLPSGCPFHERCAWAAAECRASDPPVAGIGPGRAVACHRWRQIEADVGVLPLAGARQWGGAPDEPERAGA